MSLNPPPPPKANISKVAGHLLSILVIGVVTIAAMAIAESNKDGGFWMWMGFIAAVGAMSWHAYSAAISTTGIGFKQGDTAKVQ